MRTKQFLDLGIKDTTLKCHMARVHLKNNKQNYVLKEHFSFHCCLLLFWRICQTQCLKANIKEKDKIEAYTFEKSKEILYHSNFDNFFYLLTFKIALLQIKVQKGNFS